MALAYQAIDEAAATPSPELAKPKYMMAGGKRCLIHPKHQTSKIDFLKKYRRGTALENELENQGGWEE